MNHITLASADVDAAVRFYVDVLGCRLLARWPAGAYLLAGGTWLAIVHGQAETRTGADYSHIAFDVSARDFPAVARRVQESGAETWQDNWTEGESLYFCDPDGHRLEIHATSLAARLVSATAEPWPGLVVEPDALKLASAAPTVADPRKPRRFTLAPLGVVIVLVDDDGRVLLLRRPGADGWETPNGAVEADEQPADAALRELAEEAGPVVVDHLRCFTAFRVRFHLDVPPLLSLGYVGRFVGGEVMPGDDMAGSDVWWATPAELAASGQRLAVPSQPGALDEAVRALHA